MNSNLRALILMMVILSSCQKRDWVNPYDPECSKEIWTPTNFQAVLTSKGVELSWIQSVNIISGFKLTKEVDAGIVTDLPSQTNNTLKYVDANLMDGKLHTYTIVAYAGSNQSNLVTVQITPVIIVGITTKAISAISSNTAQSGGTISTEGGAQITVRGVCWSTSSGPTIADNKTSDGIGTGTFSSTLTGLALGTTYYLRAYATNSVTAYGNEISFTNPFPPIQFNNNLIYGSLTDIEGNVYKTIVIGTQTWMAENLKTTKYKDGNAIPNVTDINAWNNSNIKTPGYCWYNNDATIYKNTYGALYNWYTVNTGKLAPTGWHVPTDAEWTILISYLGGESVARGKLKETGTTHWLSPNTNATNASGFTGLPGGYLYVSFFPIGYYAAWWSSTESNIYDSKSRIFTYLDNQVSNSGGTKNQGYYVRCIKN